MASAGWLRRFVLPAVIAGSLLGASAAHAVTIEIKDAAPDRVERQRAFAEGALPLPGTPELARLAERLAAKDLKYGQPIFIRVFKAESELEVWVQKAGRFERLDTYPICHWSGTLGPKLREGDKQNPEGFYAVGARQLHRVGRWPRSLNLGFPNTVDRNLKRSGSYILIHGGCSSTGCFAMTNPVMEEIYALSERALRAGQERIGVHVFPFRMTDANMRQHADNPWIDFWRELKPGFDAFEKTRVPPRVGHCGDRYVVETAAPGEVGEERPLAMCGEERAAQLEPSSQSLAELPPTWPLLPLTTAPMRIGGNARIPPRLPAGARPPLLTASARVKMPAVRCNLGLASCRRFVALKTQVATKRARVASVTPKTKAR